MNNETKSTYVSFKQAKWLKEKGFDVPTYGYYFNDTIVDEPCITSTLERNSSMVVTAYAAPEQHQVVEWLRVNHGIWIEVRHIKTFGINRFHIMIWDYKNPEDYMTIYYDGVGPGYKVWDTPAEAYSTAFDYIQQNNMI